MSPETPELVPLRSPIRTDINTSNPRKLFRLLKNRCIDLGYEVTDELHIEDDPVGELGYVDGRLGAAKQINHEATSSPIHLPISDSLTLPLHHLMMTLGTTSIILAVASHSIGRTTLTMTLLTVTAITAVGWYTTRPSTVTDVVKYAILVELDGELYEREETASHTDRGTARETNLTSEVTVTITPSLSNPRELTDPTHHRETFTREVKQLIAVVKETEPT